MVSRKRGTGLWGGDLLEKHNVSGRICSQLACSAPVIPNLTENSRVQIYVQSKAAERRALTDLVDRVHP